ncbi:MAG: hypothetical protein U9Q70_09310 [Chloroflexota bacterium]|nr:hypothetical protein [Chloroflexota bacterium]
MLLTGATLFHFVDLPTYSWNVRRIFGSPLGFTLGNNWLLSLLLIGLVSSGTYSLMQTHPKNCSPERALLFSLITPTLSALFASLLLLNAPSWPTWLGSLLLTGLLIGGIIQLTYQVFALNTPHYASLRTLLNIADYLLASLLFGILLNAQERALVTGPAVIILSGLLSLDLLSASGVTARKVFLWGGVISLLEGELVWILSYWSISPWTAAMLLTLGLYVGTGISYQHLLGKLQHRMIWEFILIATAMFGLLLIIQP